MSLILVVSEIRNNQLKSINFEAYTAARHIAEATGKQLATVLIGNNIQNLADIPGKYGVQQIFIVENEKLAQYSPDAYAQVVADVAKQKGADMIFMGATAMGKDLLPRVAYLLNTTLAQDVIEYQVDGQELIFKRPIFAGKVHATVKVTSQPIMATFRPKVFRPEEKVTEASRETLSVDIPEPLAVVEELLTSETGELDVTEADIVVSGGRGLKGPENWHLIDELAKVLGAAKGASRAVVDAGWRPHGEQIGQTGKTVSPTLYIACGISGAIQHLAGMMSSKYIVAINKDPDAPIFKVADYGIVGDVFEVLPKLTEEIRKVKESEA